MALPFLESIGLTEKESDIYELLLQEGEVPAQRITSKTRLKRATVYKSLYGLEAKGLISKRTLNKKIHFKPESPTELSKLAEAQINKIERAQRDLRVSLPNLQSLYTLSVERPVVQYFEGLEQVQKAYLTILEQEAEILAYVRIDEKLDAPLKPFWPRYYRIRREKNIYVKSIVPDTLEGREYKQADPKQLRETRLLPAQDFPFSIEKNICGTKVAYFSRSGKHLIATIIDNKPIAETERLIFELSWAQALSYSKLP